MQRKGGVDNYQTNTFAEGIGEGTKDIEGRNEPSFQLVIAPSPRWIIEVSSLEFGENFRGRIAFIELFEEIVALQVFFGLFLVGFESGIKDPFNIGR